MKRHPITTMLRPPHGFADALLVTPAIVLWIAAAIAPAAGQPPNPMLPDSVMDGWRVFAQKQCIQCHAVWGLGGQIGPDLGRIGQQRFTAGQLAGAMWNHIPRVYSHMRRNHLEYPSLDQEQMSDLFSFLFFVRYLDEPGDVSEGLRILREKGCSSCHAAEDAEQRRAPDLKRLASYALNPIVWAQRMWEHAPQMNQAMRKAGITWPQLNDTDLVNIMAYLRSVGGHEAKVYLQPGSAKTGASLFTERRCQACHHPGGAGKDLTTTALPRSLAALASRMWNHSPKMTQTMEAQGIERSPLSAQEMADIIAYIISLRYDDRGGDPERGRGVLEAKRCTQCHAETTTPGLTAPTIETLGVAASPVRLAQAMWNHGVAMMERMSEIGIAWPVFQPSEMVDLIAYFRSIKPAEKPGALTVQRVALPLQPRPSPLLPPIEPGGSCVTNACHPGVIAGRVVHAPAAQGECDTCHRQPDPQTHLFEFVSTNSDLCYQCHENRLTALQEHGPVSVGVCTACHNPHSDDSLFGQRMTGEEVCFADLVGMTVALETLVGREIIPEPSPIPEPIAAPPSTPSAPAPIALIQGGCVTTDCHPDLVSGGFVHGPVAQQQCEACHTLTDEQNHGFELTANEPGLCFECHDRPMETEFTHGPVALGLCTSCHDPHSGPQPFMLPEAGNDLCFICHTEMSEHVLESRNQHQVIQEEGCLFCHDAHRSNLEFQLKKDMPDLCLQCHESTGEVIATATTAHEPVSTGKMCVNCHNPHGSDVPKILVNTQMNLCLGCHNEPMDTPNGPIIDMKSWIENNPERHGPIREDNCTGCHQPHGSNNFRILKYAFPQEFYRPFSLETYALCFQCHEETILLDERTTTLTNFRNGDKNLHYLHVNREKGRTCRACHEIHAGTKPNRIKDFVPFGKTWMYPVNYEKTETGGQCAPGCHVERAYDRLQEIIQD